MQWLASVWSSWPWLLDLHQRRLVDPIFLPGPKAIWDAAVHMIADGTLWTDMVPCLPHHGGLGTLHHRRVPLGLLRRFASLRLCLTFRSPTRYMPVVALILTIL